MPKNIARLVIAAFILMSPISYAKQVYEYKLENGLKVFVKQDKRAPVANFQIWYRVGSADEPSGLTGIAHVLEHMMFKGTKKYPNGQFARIITENGGKENASTYYDWTKYFQVMSTDHLEDSFKLEADRMKNLTLDKAEFAKEIKVVMEERRMRIDSNPRRITSERFEAVAYLQNPYHHPVIGWMNDLEQLTINDVRNWYKQWYVPNNATIVVVGNVDPKNVLQLANKYFGPLKKHKLPRLKQPQEIPPLGERRLTLNVPAKLPWLLMGYNMPHRADYKNEWEPYAVEVITAILDGGDSARFKKELIREKQIVSGANASYDFISRYPNLFTLSATPSKGHTLTEVEQALRDQIKRLQTNKVSQRELQRVKNQVIASKVYDQDSISIQALLLGLVDNVGLPWQFIDQYPEKIQAITADQVLQVAKRYLVPEHLTIANLQPKEST